MGWFGGKKRSPEPSWQDTTSRKVAVDVDQLRDLAVATWIRTFPQDSRLDDFLNNTPPALREEVERSCHDICHAASELLEQRAATGIVDMPKFRNELREQLQQTFPWMGEAAFEALSRYTSWYAWHEGYDR